MRMRTVISVLVAALTVSLTGCAHEEQNMPTQLFEMALTDNSVIQMQLPADWSLTELDGYHYWKFGDDTTIYKEHSPVSTGDKKGECYYSTYAVSRNFDGYTITISTNKKLVDSVGAMLNAAKVVERDVPQYRERALEYLPEFQDYAMDFTTNGLYMPIDYSEVANDVYTACSSINGTNFVTCWVMNYKLEDLKPLLNNLVTCNQGGKLDSWYESSDTYYAECGGYVVGAKKLKYNQWCCYLASDGGFDDYLRKALTYVIAAD